MKRLVALVMVLTCLVPISASAEDQGSSPAPAPSPTMSKSTQNFPANTAAPTLESTLAKIRKLVESKKFAAALTALKGADRDFPNNADINNLLGFASRNLKQFSASEKYYVKALKLNPNHLGALEYQGELFLKLKKVALAKGNLAKLKKLCGTSCEEYLDLKKAIGTK